MHLNIRSLNKHIETCVTLNHNSPLHLMLYAYPNHALINQWLIHIYLVTYSTIQLRIVPELVVQLFTFPNT